MKILFADYEEGYAIMELIGEWNDCLQNDIMFLKRKVVEKMESNGIFKYILICENVLNFHGSDDCYYEEWHEEVTEEGGWICLVNVLSHVEDEMKETRLQPYMHFGGRFNDVNWRPQKPKALCRALEALVTNAVRGLTY